MTDKAATAGPAAARAPWGDLLREGRALYSILVILGVALHALMILVISIIMPTVVGDLGGADFYTWPALLYTVGAIVGAASLGPVWRALGRRNGSLVSGAAFLAGSVGCAVAPDMATLIAARALQGFGGGLIAGGGMAIISAFFTDGLRRRLLAAHQGTWMVAQLMGPVVGGLFAEIGWWRGSFWTMVPLALLFLGVVWARMTDESGDGARREATAFPFLRLTLLSSGVMAVALAGPVAEGPLRWACLAAAVALIWATFRLDRRSANRLYPSGLLSLRSPVGLALLVLFFGGMAQTSVNLFVPLLLQIVYEVTPLLISYIMIVISLGWTVGTFAVSGWSGRRERIALLSGPVMMFLGLAGIAASVAFPSLVLMTVCAFALGLGVGIHNVHLVARTMANAVPGEERITSAALPSIRSLGTAFGAAVAGGISTMAGLGMGVSDPAVVSRAVTLVYGVQLVPLALAAAAMVALVRISRPGQPGAGRH